MLGPAELLLPPLTIAGSVLSLPFAPLFNAHKYGIRHAWFKAFWTWFGPATRPIFAPSVRPLLATCSGVVVDVGPGDGTLYCLKRIAPWRGVLATLPMSLAAFIPEHLRHALTVHLALTGVWLAEFAKAVKACSGRITKIYGIEPNPLLHARLAKAVKEHGLQDVYVPICARIQDLEKHGIARGSIDTIVTVHVLCSVGDRVDAISKELYTYLKPGGTWQVFEHVAARTAPIRIWQGKCASHHNPVCG